MALSERQQEFINMLMPAAMEASQRTGVDPRIIIAQAAQETGWGRSAPNNNYFGIKSHGQGGGSTLMTHEYVNGQRVDMPQSFRGYQSPEASVRGYADFITSNPRYRPFMAASGDLDRQLEELQASGYATDPTYSQSVGSIARNIPIPGQPQATFASSSTPATTHPNIIPQRPASFPTMAPTTQRVAQAPMPPQRPGMLGGLLNAGQNAMNAVQGVRQGVQQTAQNVGGSLQGNPIARAMLNNQVRDFWSNPNMGTVISRAPVQGRQGVAVQTVGQGGGQQAYATPSMRSGRRNSSINSPEAVIRRANSAAIREATGSGAINRNSIADALSRGATLVRRA